jgi:hypothetical protein
MPFQFQVPYTQGNDASAFNEGMQSAGGMVAQAIQNQLRQQQIQQAQIQNQYLPQQLQSDIAFKQAQTNMLPLQAMGQYYGGLGRFNAYNPQMQLTRMLQTLPPAMKAQVLAQHPEYASILNNQFSVAGGGASGVAQPQPQNPNLNITTSNAPITNTGNLPTLPMPNAGREQQMVNQGGFNQNNLTVNPAQLASYNQAAAVDYSNAAGKSFDQMPKDNKSAVLAQLQAMGLPYDQATQYLRSGGTVTGYAVSKGFGTDPTKWPTAQFAPTNQTISQTQQRQSRESEADILSAAVSNIPASYAGHNIDGYSPAAIKDLMFNQNDPTTFQNLTNLGIAKGISSDLSMSRAVLSGNPKPGIESTRDMTNNMMTNIGLPRALVGGKLWLAIQSGIQSKIDQAAQQAYQTSLRQGVPYKGPSFTVQGGSSNAPQSQGLGASVANSGSGNPSAPQVSAKPHYSMSDINDFAKRKNMTPQQVMSLLSAHGATYG